MMLTPEEQKMGEMAENFNSSPHVPGRKSAAEPVASQLSQGTPKLLATIEELRTKNEDMWNDHRDLYDAYEGLRKENEWLRVATSKQLTTPSIDDMMTEAKADERRD